jgi:RNA polymerase sigma-70 factor, ECF subfamily
MEKHLSDRRLDKRFDFQSMEPGRALELIMDEYGEELKRFIFTYTKNLSLTEDITQEVFVSVYLKLSQFSGQSSLRTWIYSIAINKCKDYFRSWHYRKVRFMGKYIVSDMTHFQSPEQIVTIQEENLELIEQILTLPMKYREILLLFYYKEFSLQEIGELLRIGEGAVKSRLHRARKKLKTVFINDNGVEL